MGAVLGDGVELGCIRLHAGNACGTGTLAYPCAVLRGVIPGGCVIKVVQDQKITPRKTS